jgi:hypothetical protein
MDDMMHDIMMMPERKKAQTNLIWAWGGYTFANIVHGTRKYRP